MDTIYDDLRKLCRKRGDLVRTKGDATRRIFSKCIRVAPDGKLEARKKWANKAKRDIIQGKEITDPVLDTVIIEAVPFLQCLTAVHKPLLEAELNMRHIARTLPTHEWIISIRGVSELGMAIILGETGPLSRFPNVQKLWKFMSLSVENGEAQRARKGVNNGYSPQKRSIMHVAGDAMIKSKGPYRAMYLTRKIFEEQKTPEEKKYILHKRALRYMEKNFLKDWWNQWTGHSSHSVR